MAPKRISSHPIKKDNDDGSSSLKLDRTTMSSKRNSYPIKKHNDDDHNNDVSSSSLTDNKKNSTTTTNINPKVMNILRDYQSEQSINTTTTNSSSSSSSWSSSLLAATSCTISSLTAAASSRRRHRMQKRRMHKKTKRRRQGLCWYRTMAVSSFLLSCYVMDTTISLYFHVNSTKDVMMQHIRGFNYHPRDDFMEGEDEVLLLPNSQIPDSPQLETMAFSKLDFDWETNGKKKRSGNNSDTKRKTTFFLPMTTTTADFVPTMTSDAVTTVADAEKSTTTRKSEEEPNGEETTKEPSLIPLAKESEGGVIRMANDSSVAKKEREEVLMNDYYNKPTLIRKEEEEETDTNEEYDNTIAKSSTTLVKEEAKRQQQEEESKLLDQFESETYRSATKLRLGSHSLGDQWNQKDNVAAFARGRTIPTTTTLTKTAAAVDEEDDNEVKQQQQYEEKEELTNAVPKSNEILKSQKFSDSPPQPTPVKSNLLRGNNYKKEEEEDDKLITAKKEYETMCYLRYIAMAANGGGHMSDYDTIPLNMPAAAKEMMNGTTTTSSSSSSSLLLPNGGDFTTYGNHVPALLAGRSEQWDYIATRLIEEGQKHSAVNKDKGFVFSDMFALEQIIQQNKNEVKVMDPKLVVEPGYFAPIGGFPALLTGEFKMKPQRATTPCDQLNAKRAMHISHESLYTNELDMAYRGLYMGRVLQQYHDSCGGPEFFKSAKKELLLGSNEEETDDKEKQEEEKELLAKEEETSSEIKEDDNDQKKKQLYYFSIAEQMRDHLLEDTSRIWEFEDDGRPIMNTFFHPISGTVSKKDAMVIAAWKHGWDQQGWNPRILSLKDAKKHPKYLEINEQIRRTVVSPN